MLIRFPLTFEQPKKRERRSLPTWVINFAGLMVVVLWLVLTYIVLAAITE